jgi:ABC-type dipeptide/oligopeptide/nickel transport system permease subunit
MTFWLGSDDQGRDMLSAIFYGLRISLGVGVLSTLTALAIGLAIGLTAAWFGGWEETVIMRLVDIQLSFPSILIALVLLAVLGQGCRQDRDCAGRGAMGVLRAHGARGGAGRAQQGLHRGGSRACALSCAAHPVPPPAAQLACRR